MYAIIETGGKQYRIEKNEEFRTEKIEGTSEGEEIEFDKVLMISDPGKDGEGEIILGKPYLKDAAVKAQVVDKGRGDKITIFKYKKRKRYRRKMGHRQLYMRLRVVEIKR